LAFKSQLARFSDPDEESLGTMPEDLGNGQVGARFSSKMNEDMEAFEQSIGTRGFPSAGGGLDDDTPF
jgi:replicative DNA helicase